MAEAEEFIKNQAAEINLEYANNLEELAAGHLKVLISKSLVIVSKGSSNGGVKGVLFMMCCVTRVLKKVGKVYTPDESLYAHLVTARTYANFWLQQTNNVLSS